MKKIIIIIGLIIIVFVSFSIIFLNPASLTPEEPKGKTMYYTEINNDEVKTDVNNRYEYTLDNGYHFLLFLSHQM